MPRVSGTKIHAVEGIEIYVMQRPAKRQVATGFGYRFVRTRISPGVWVQLWRTRTAEI
jgi:hypothetical protein